jgi:TPR repeat protein
MLMKKKHLALFLCLILMGMTFPVAVIADTAEESFKKGRVAARNQDWETAEREYKKAAEQGHLHAQIYLALMYPCYNDREAAKWFRKAAQQGASGAQLALADLLVDGGCDGTVRNYEEAMQWYRQAAKSKDVTHQVEACAGIAKMYEDGLGIAVDLVSAHMWYDLASQIAGTDTVGQDDFTGETIDVVSARDRLARKLSSEQIGRSRQMQKEWKGRNSN